MGKILYDGQDWVMLGGNIEGEDNNIGSIPIFLQLTGKTGLSFMVE